MTLMPDVHALAPMLRGLILSQFSSLCMVQEIPDSSGKEQKSLFDLHLADVEAGVELEDRTLASSLTASLREAFSSSSFLRSTLEKEGTLEFTLRDARGTILCRLLAHALGQVDPRLGLQVREPGNPALLSVDLQTAVVKGRIALVTGAAQGFGAEIARGLARSGAIVWIADINASAAQAFACTLEQETGIPAYSLAVDVRDPSSVSTAFETVTRTTGGLDLVVSNAGVLRAGSVLEQSLDEFRFVTEVNYYGFFNITKQAARIMRLQWLCAPDWYTDIIQINSKSGLQGSNRNGAYAGSKFGSIGLVQSFALELIDYRIKVNAICPGNFFDGPLWSDPVNGLFVQYLKSGKVPGAKSVEDVRAFYEAKIPMRRGCYGPDVMKAIYYLMSQVYETGQALPVTGGQVMLN